MASHHQHIFSPRHQQIKMKRRNIRENNRRCLPRQSMIGPHWNQSRKWKSMAPRNRKIEGYIGWPAKKSRCLWKSAIHHFTAALTIHEIIEIMLSAEKCSSKSLRISWGVIFTVAPPRRLRRENNHRWNRKCYERGFLASAHRRKENT